MKLKIVCIKDNIQGFATPECKMSEQAAMRDFAFGVNQPGLLQFKPEDYSLWLIGEYDTNTGIIEACEKKLICEAINVIQREVKNV